MPFVWHTGGMTGSGRGSNQYRRQGTVRARPALLNLQVLLPQASLLAGPGTQPALVQLPAAARRLLGRIAQAGGRPLLVGGCVRDALLGQHQPKDIDIEVHGPVQAQDLVDALRQVGEVGEVGRSFGVLKVRSGGHDFDVSLPRRDSKTGVGHRGFKVTTDTGLSVREAAARRDYTINAISWDPATGQILDPWAGQADLAAGVLRHTSAAFAEDPLRVLRGIQFAGRFGFRLADETAELCRTLAFTYPELARERIWAEWSKLLSRGTHISVALQQLRRTGWDQHYPELTAMYGVPQEPEWHPEGDVYTHTGLAADQAAVIARQDNLNPDERTLLVATVLVHDMGKPACTSLQPRPDGTSRIIAHGHAEAGVEPASQFLGRIGAPSDLINQALPLVREHMVLSNAPQPSPSAVRRLARRLQPATVMQLALVVQADRAGRGTRAAQLQDVQRWTELARQLQVEQRPAPNLLRGQHLIGLGLQPGPAFSTVLRAAQKAQDNGRFQDEAGALRWLRSYIAGAGLGLASPAI